MESTVRVIARYEHPVYGHRASIRYSGGGFSIAAHPQDSDTEVLLKNSEEILTRIRYNTAGPPPSPGMRI